jgi:hypothetical protein
MIKMKKYFVALALILIATPAFSVSLDYREEIESIRSDLPEKRLRSLDRLINHFEEVYDVRELVIIAMIDQETDFRNIQSEICVEENHNDECIQYERSCGYMQIRPETAEMVTSEKWTCRELILNYQENIRIGVKYLHDLREKYDTIKEAILMYNGGGNKSYDDEVSENYQRLQIIRYGAVNHKLQ